MKKKHLPLLADLLHAASRFYEKIDQIDEETTLGKLSALVERTSEYARDSHLAWKKRQWAKVDDKRLQAQGWPDMEMLPLDLRRKLGKLFRAFGYSEASTALNPRRRTFGKVSPSGFVTEYPKTPKRAFRVYRFQVPGRAMVAVHRHDPDAMLVRLDKIPPPLTRQLWELVGREPLPSHRPSGSSDLLGPGEPLVVASREKLKALGEAFWGRLNTAPFATSQEDFDRIAFDPRILRFLGFSSSDIEKIKSCAPEATPAKALLFVSCRKMKETYPSLLDRMKTFPHGRDPSNTDLMIFSYETLSAYGVGPEELDWLKACQIDPKASSN